jgi:hypothetical protein
MIYLDYCKEGKPIPDFYVEEFIKEIIIWTINRKDDLIVKVSTCNIVDMVRTYIAEEKININDLKFLFEGKEVYVDEYGCTPGSLKGYCDIFGDIAMRRILAGIARRKSKKENI